MQRQTPLGQMVVHEEVLATIAGMAAAKSAGIVGMATRRASEGYGEGKKPENLGRGVSITEDAQGLVVDLYVVVRYGVEIGKVGKNMAERVSDALDQAVGIKPRRIMIHVEGVRP